MFEQLPGLVQSPRALTLHVDRNKIEETGEIFGWYIYDKKSDKRYYIAKPAVEGKLVAIRMHIQEYNKDLNYKAVFTIDSGERVWNIKSGVDTIFTRGLVFGLTKLAEQSPLSDVPKITIEASPGDTAVYGSIWVSGQQIRTERDDDTKLFPLIQALQKMLGQEPQTPASIQKDFDDYKGR